MSIQLKPPPQRRLLKALEALFREARALERRRRMRRAMLAALTCALGAGLGFLLANAGDGSRAASGDRPISVAVSSVTLPISADYLSLAVVDGRVIVSGGPQGSLFPSVSIASTSSGRSAPLDSQPSATCDSAVVSATLRLTDRMSADCADPALYHERAISVGYWVNSRGTSWIETRIARADPAAPDGYTLGPVVMRYGQCSDCWAQQIYGDGSLWIYDGFIGSNQNLHGELLRISESTGTVVQRWTMPSLARALVAVNADGFWLAPSIDSGWPGGSTPAQRVPYQSLYRVSPGAPRPSRLLTVGPDGALWLVASGHAVWLDVGDVNRGPNVLWHLKGAVTTPTLHASYPGRSTQGDEFGEGAPTYAGNATIGIYYVTTDFPATGARATQRITRLSPDAASERTVAVIPAPSSVTPNSFGFSSPAAVAVGRSFFFLDPPGTAHGTSVLYRVTPKGQ